jgi:hypothetical protein
VMSVMPSAPGGQGSMGAQAAPQFSGARTWASPKSSSLKPVSRVPPTSRRNAVAPLAGADDGNGRPAPSLNSAAPPDRPE